MLLWSLSRTHTVRMFTIRRFEWLPARLSLSPGRADSTLIPSRGPQRNRLPIIVQTRNSRRVFPRQLCIRLSPIGKKRKIDGSISIGIKLICNDSVRPFSCYDSLIDLLLHNSAHEPSSPAVCRVLHLKRWGEADVHGMFIRINALSLSMNRWLRT